MEAALRTSMHVESYPPGTGAGQPIVPDQNTAATTGYNQYKSHLADSQSNVYAPFASKLEWDIARWSKLRGPGSTSCSELLGIEGVGS